MNKKILIIVVAVLAVLGLAVGWYMLDQNNQEERANTEAQSYIADKKSDLAKLQEFEVSTMVPDATLTRQQVNQQQTTCEELDDYVDQIQRDIPHVDRPEIVEVESDYAQGDLLRDALRYRDICWFYVTYYDYDNQAKTALDSAEHDEFLLGKPDCNYGLCFKPEMSQEYHQWRTENVLRPLEANRDYYQDRDCPLSINGGEQFCNAIANYASINAQFEGFYLREIDNDELTSNDPDVARSFVDVENSFNTLQAHTAAIGDFEHPNAVYRYELAELEKLFASKQL